ncbi:hypothetical protein Mp_7g04530 [Marchantia polymorpha subsp. ruderalis]|uniref:Uncharacterized protein n=2 Tax=Marchantia polymorpha TaxID=3197 RepID=A0AAF6BW43_MARPO|nr:hypothetical protein MARPO_0062s0072 [Marchantia polymorpha]BBN16227.1 hypothetical protein Mp_7g04530 [Marchantia polymorpha subsp. ruderalis]|eukprot:PTQ36654.1 hypothetical protein MARPO_0062s0072 [Marchantia polymorpha]
MHMELFACCTSGSHKMVALTTGFLCNHALNLGHLFPTTSVKVNPYFSRSQLMSVQELLQEGGREGGEGRRCSEISAVFGQSSSLNEHKKSRRSFTELSRGPVGSFRGGP